MAAFQVGFAGIDADVGRANSGKDERQMRLSDRVDELERGLAMGLKDYRQHAEENLAKHMEALERTECQQLHEMSMLRAENQALRNKLGIMHPQDPAQLFQSVMFQDAGPPGYQPERDASIPGAVLKRSNTRAATMSRTTHDDGGRDMLNFRGRKNDKSSTTPGGSWQPFVAWVPNGAALRNPEPWKPLPPEQTARLVSSDNAMVKSKTLGANVGATSPSVEKMTAVLPGSTDKSDDDSQSDSEDSKGREVFEVLEGWRASKHQLAKLRKNANLADGQSRVSGFTSVQDMDEEQASFEHHHIPYWYVVHPHSKKRILWDVSSLALVIYDMIMIPMSAFNLPETLFLMFMDWTTRLFWTLDMGWSCCTGIVLQDGTIESDIKKLVTRYLKTWFILDVFIVGSDWTEVTLAQTGMQSLGRLTRIFRIVRAVRLLRLVRMQEVVATITERVQSDKLAFLMSIAKMLIFVVGFAHVTACLWWVIGDQDVHTRTWVSVSEYYSKSINSQYLMSLHWALSQFTGGMDEVTPTNALERFYAVVVWIFAFMAAAIIISTLTSSLTQVHIIGGGHSRHMATLRKYLKQNRISSNLALRVQRSAQHAVSGDLTPDAVDLLQVVSDPLKVEMHFEMYALVVRCHPFFCDYIAEGRQVMRRVCHYAMSTLLLAKDDVIFSKGEFPAEPKMYFVVKGQLDYTYPGGWEAVTIAAGQWLAEAALWTQWTHRGTLTATNDVKMVLLDAKPFQDICTRYKESGGFDPKLYAADFVSHLNQQDDVSDLTTMVGT